MKKKLLHIVLYLPYGGLEKIVYDLSVALNGKEYEVHVAALQAGGQMQDMLESAGIPVHVLGKRPGKIDLKLLAKLFNLIKKFDIDIIHSHSGCIMYAALAGRLAGVKRIIHTEHGRYFPDRLGKIWEDRLFSILINKFVCVSNELEKYMLSVVKISRKRLTTIINGIDTTKYYKVNCNVANNLRHKFSICYDAQVLGVISRLIPQKNISFLVKWMKLYSQKYDKLLLLIVGDGPELKELQKKANVITGNRVKFLGAISDIAEILNIFDIFTLVSTTEGTSLTILEAMSTKLPVVVSNVGGNKSIVCDGKNGFIFKCNDKDDFSRCINMVLEDANIRLNIGKAARETVVDCFSLDVMVGNYCKLYG